MVYTQVVTLATYVFFIFTVIGRQKVHNDTANKTGYMRSGRMPLDIDLYIPIFTVLQFFFYMGLLKARTSHPIRDNITITLIHCLCTIGRRAADQPLR